ncbi:four-carbon acid sugar kinase family protein [Georgenia halophila]|uniref:3-oxo-tetronate kinase n=1 Tax=Georgenia halophila TaxID=620889 RepID=A0ABP8LMV9_9MICO
MPEEALPIGVVADDLTGATDLALMASERGLRSVVCVDVPAAGTVPPDADVLVVALRSRTAPVATAVDASRRALGWLRQQGARRFHLKYCSTFDSTPRGNIGPVLEALLDDLGSPTTVVVPSFPATGRTVYRGYLFVGNELLAESSMRDHPLTPMRDSHLVRLLQPQMSGRVSAVALEHVRGDLPAALDAARRGGVRAVVLDAIEDGDLAAIHRATADLPLTTGAAGLVTAWGRGGESAAVAVGAPGPSVSLVGSQSRASREQVERARAHQPVLAISPPAGEDGVAPAADRAVGWCLERWSEDAERPVLVHAAPPDSDVSPDEAALLERTFARTAATLAARGVRRFVVGGGETSGSVIAALDVRTLAIGPAISPGVCWASGELAPGDPGTGLAGEGTSTRAAPGTTGEVSATCALSLKSGNFGGPDFFVDAWEMLR